VKLLLDEMFPLEIAVQLRRRGSDVVAVLEREELMRRRDRIVFAAAQEEARAVVTENRDDFLEIDAEYRRRGYEHHGLVITSRGFSRRGSAGTGQLVMALERFLQGADEYPLEPSFVRWLQ
jgi:predicted nuclease of predicted toxin-antitoxin system